LRHFNFYSRNKQPNGSDGVNSKPINQRSHSKFWQSVLNLEMARLSVQLGRYLYHVPCRCRTQTPKGLYYINWGKDETKQNGATKDSFHPPPKTMVEVVAKVNNKYQFPSTPRDCHPHRHHFRPNPLFQQCSSYRCHRQSLIDFRRQH
jgi:hypothetical protein